MKRYTVKELRHDFKPNPIELRFGKVNEKRICCIDASCWYSAETVPNWFDPIDVGDINKLWGYTYAFSVKSKYSAIVGWRPSEKENYFEIFGYINYPDGKRSFYPIGEIEANQNFETMIFWDNSGLAIALKGAGVPIVADLKAPWIMLNISAWFGGNQPAPKQMIVWVE